MVRSQPWQTPPLEVRAYAQRLRGWRTGWLQGFALSPSLQARAQGHGGTSVPPHAVVVAVEEGEQHAPPLSSRGAVYPAHRTQHSPLLLLMPWRRRRVTTSCCSSHLGSSYGIATAASTSKFVVLHALPRSGLAPTALAVATARSLRSCNGVGNAGGRRWCQPRPRWVSMQPYCALPCATQHVHRLLRLTKPQRRREGKRTARQAPRCARSSKRLCLPATCRLAARYAACLSAFALCCAHISLHCVRLADTRCTQRFRRVCSSKHTHRPVSGAVLLRVSRWRSCQNNNC